MANDLYRPPEADLRVPDPSALDLAGIGDRFVATLIDQVLPVIALFGIGVATGSLDAEADLLLGFAGVFAIAWIVVELLLMGTRGQSIGKLAVRIRVVRPDGERVSFWRYFFLRALPILLISRIPLIGWLFVLTDSLFIFRDDRRRCIHDIIADTIVVHAR